MKIFKNKNNTRLLFSLIVFIIFCVLIYYFKKNLLFSEVDFVSYKFKLEYLFEKYFLISNLVLIIMSIIWIIFTGLGTPIIIINSLFFNILNAMIISSTVIILGSLICYYLFKKFFFKKLSIKVKKFIPNYKKYFKKNSVFLFYLFRSTPGIPLHIKNTFPALFGISYKIFLIVTILVEIPTILMNILLIKGLIDLTSEQYTFSLITFLKISIPLMILILISIILRKLRLQNNLN